MYPFSFLRTWSIVRRCVASQRELEAMYLTNGTRSSGIPSESGFEIKLMTELADKLRAAGGPSDLELAVQMTTGAAPIRWVTPEGADLREDMRELSRSTYQPRHVYGHARSLVLIKPCCGRTTDQPCLYSCLI